ncbi:MAG: polysaccharide pyruvyl transferase family protein [Coriobacteriales bacterium]|nr:polysaccharide pyruvyl transferase family protein [Coriobacteriales bacterium]
MASTEQWRSVTENLLARRMPTSATRRELPVVLDVAMGSENVGDAIIMDYCGSILASIFGDEPLVHVATHAPSPELEELEGQLKILCGTNIVYTHMAYQGQWALPQNMASMRDVCLLGVGLSDRGISDEMDLYSRALFRALLAPDLYHSVRDSDTCAKLRAAGFDNVINTACPTMWRLTPEHLSQIPAKKGKAVLTSITDYALNSAQDREMIRILEQEYEELYIWVQGSMDVEWGLSSMLDLDRYQVVGPALADLDALLDRPDVDYVGTRLHAGIRALNHGRRSLIVVVDNRARSIARDTGLPVIERDEVTTGALEQWVNHPQATELQLPWETIQLWKEQFRGHVADATRA